MGNEFESLIKSSDDINNTKVSDISSITDVLIEDIKSYNNIISSFFVGKENEIKQIYNSIKNKKLGGFDKNFSLRNKLFVVFFYKAYSFKARKNAIDYYPNRHCRLNRR